VPGLSYLLSSYRKREEKADRPGIARTALGNKYAKLSFALMKHEVLYRPRSFASLVQSPRDYYLSVYGEILRKLKAFSSEKIKQKLEKEYAIDLSKFGE